MKKGNSIRFLAAGLSMALTLSVVGCAGKSSDSTGNGTSSNSSSSTAKAKIRIAYTYAGSSSKAKYFQPMLKKFADDNKDKIELVEETTSSSSDEQKTKIKVDLASNNLPDVFSYWGGSSMKPLVDSNKLLNIDEYLKVSKSLNKEDINSGAWAFYTLNNVSYGIPIEGYMSAFVVNKNLFSKYNLQYPKTEKDLLDVAKVFNQNGIVPLALGSKGGNPSHFYFSELYNQFAGGTDEINNLPTTYKFATDNAYKVAKIIDEQRKAGVYPKDTVSNGDWGPSFELYNSGKAAMVYTYPWQLTNMKPEMSDISEIIPVPKMDGATKDPATFVNSSAVYGFVINKASFEDSKKKDAITSLMDLITSEAMFKELVKGGVVPTRKITMDYSSVNPMMKKAYEYTDKLERDPAHFNTFPDETAELTFQNTLDEVFAGATTPDAFVNKVQADLDKVKK